MAIRELEDGTAAAVNEALAEREREVTRDHEFWKHLTIVEATVLGLSVGVVGASSAGYSAMLVAAWMALLMGIAVGCVLLRLGISAHAVFRARFTQYKRNMRQIAVLVETNEIEEDSTDASELRQLAIARILPEAFTTREDRVREERYGNRFIEGPIRRRVVAEWLWRWSRWVERVFYLLSVGALLLLLLSVVTRGDRDRPAGTVGGGAGRGDAIADPRADTSRSGEQATP